MGEAFIVRRGGGGGRYSLLTVTTEEETLQSAAVTVIGTDPISGKIDTKTRNMVNGSVTIKLKYLTTYTITCSTATPQTLQVPYYADYLAEITLREYIYNNGVAAEGLEMNATGNFDVSSEEGYIEVSRSGNSTNSCFNIVKQFNLTGSYAKVVVKGEVIRRRSAAGGSIPNDIPEFAAATVNKATNSSSTITHKSENLPNVVGNFTSELSLAGITGTMWCGFIGQNYSSSNNGEILHITEIYLE